MLHEPRLLATIGFMVYLRKCTFYVAWAVALGLKVSYAMCALGAKYLKKWLSQHLLGNLSELQSVVGHLTWAGCFVPGVKELITRLNCCCNDQRVHGLRCVCCTQQASWHHFLTVVVRNSRCN